MLDQNEIAALRAGTFVLDCPEIVLTQLVPSPRVLRGPGRFSQDHDGTVRVTVYARDVDLPANAFFPSTPPGVMVPDSEYFSLEAVDFRSRTWRADRIYVNENHSMPQRFSVANGRVAPLRGSRDREPREGGRFAVTGYAFTEIQFPSNTRSQIDRSHGSWQSHGGSWDVAEFLVDGVNLHIHHEHQALVLSAGADTSLPGGYPTSLLEALRFVSAKEFWWDLLCEYIPEREQVTIYERSPEARGGTVPPPLPTNYADAFADITELFACYLRFLCGADDPDVTHLLSAEWGEVLRAGVGTLQTQATIFSIAVEAVLRMVFTERPVEVERDREALAEVRHWIARVREVLETEGAPEELRSRFEGLLSPMTGLSQRERLNALAERGAIDLSLAQRWQRLRPVSAHGDRPGQGDADPLYQECIAVLGLLYQLVAHLVGYRGRLRSLGERGWPIRPYPLPLPPPATPVDTTTGPGASDSAEGEQGPPR